MLRFQILIRARGCETRAKEGVCHRSQGDTHVELADVILNNRVTTVSLINPDFTLSSHVVESLLRVNTSLQGGSPRGSVDGGTPLLGVREVLPVDKEGDGVFSTGVAAHARGDTSGG